MGKKRAIINLIYSPQKGAPHKIYENENGEVWRSKSYDNTKLNVGMGWYSIRDPKKETDSLLAIEPYCVLPKDYETRFAKRFKHVFTWATKAFSHPALAKKIIPINHPSCWGIAAPEQIGKNWPAWNERKDEIVFVANNKTSTHESQLYSSRIALADYIEKHSKYKVAWYGQIPLKRDYFVGQLNNKHEKLKNSKFSICIENSYHSIYTHNYFTEKMPEVWLAGAVPLYMGCYNIDSFGFPKNSYIDLRPCIKKGRADKLHLEKSEFKTILDTIHKFDAKDYESYTNTLKKEVLHNGKLHDIISFTKMYDTIINTYFKEINS